MLIIACGTVAILHAIGNLKKDLYDSVVQKDFYLDKFFKDTKGDASLQKMSPADIANYLSEDRVIDTLHSEASCAGQSAVPSVEEIITNHFICFRYVTLFYSTVQHILHNFT